MKTVNMVNLISIGPSGDEGGGGDVSEPGVNSLKGTQTIHHVTFSVTQHDR